MPQTDYYKHNPLIHRTRKLSKSPSEWVRSFSCEDLKPLIVCRGPIRKEAMDVYEEMGISHYGILLSEKDSIIYPNALAPELRQLTDSKRVHRVPDYSGASKEERVERINQIISMAKDNGYDSIFAGYGFMAEDEEFVAAIEKAGLKFIGPCAATQASAGKKDEAKRTALNVNVSVTPGIDNVTLRDYLRTLTSVGVGYYPNSSFVHLDVRDANTYWVDYAGPGEAPRKTNSRDHDHDQEADGDLQDPEVSEGDRPSEAALPTLAATPYPTLSAPAGLPTPAANAASNDPQNAPK